MEWWLREYRLTPAEVRTMPAWFVRRMPALAALRNEVIEQKRREE